MPSKPANSHPALALPPGIPRTLAYLGTPEIAVPPLAALVDAGYEVRLVVSGPDKRRGRGAATTPSPVKTEALRLGLRVTDNLDDLVSAGVDLGVVVAYGRIIPTRILEALPMVNLHFSLLPRWRGAAPVERAVLEGDTETGVCVMGVVPELDAGPVFDMVRLQMTGDETVDELRSRLTSAGATLLVESLAAGLGEPVPQVGEVTYANKITVEDLHLDWSASREALCRVVRLGGAWTTFRGKRLKIWSVAAPASSQLDGVTSGSAERSLAAGQIELGHSGLIVGTGDGPLEIIEVQPEAKRRTGARAWANGAHLGSDECFGAAL